MTDVDMFVATGLLASSRNQILPAEEQSPMISEFMSNGLLGGSLMEGFVETGLLSGANTDGIQQQSMNNEQLPDSFQPNGLLDVLAETKDSSSHQPNDEGQSESQDEPMPTISEILRPYSSGVPSTSPLATSSTLRSISATTQNGKAVYIKRKSNSGRTRTDVDCRSTAGLLETPVHKLKEQLSEETAIRLSRPVAAQAAAVATGTLDDQLWVDRYRPKRFMELLGDERVHRETMSWLKEWDYCVFGKRRGLKAKKPSEENPLYRDEYRRPQEKILLLSGPPGLGKTTLAHVIAHQAGYDVLEINASDARSGQVVDDRIKPALETGSAVGSKRPVCVVIDEIDGATGAGDGGAGFVFKLISLTFDRGKKRNRAGEKRDSKGKRPLLRPIICICNDLYASSLTKLRQHSHIVRFTRPADIYLSKRLREICDIEGLRADSRALTALVGLSRGDIRGCLNVLQFIKGKNQDVTENVLREAAAGMKEGDGSFTTVLGNLFAPLSKKRVKDLAMNELDESRYVGRLSRDLEASDSLDKIAWGCLEHYTNLRQSDPSLMRHQKANDWLTTYDILSGTMWSEREFAIMPYLTYMLVPFYPLFQERGGGRVDRPKAGWENSVKTKANEEIYKSLARCVRTTSNNQSVVYRHLMSNDILQLEFAPLINRIISPPLRPVNSQVIKPVERALLQRLVEIMVSLELRFVQETAEDGQLVYRLDPPIDVFVTYDGKRAADIPVSRYATRHLVAGEIDALLIARQAEAVEKGKTKTLDFFRGATTHEEADEVETPESRDIDGKLMKSNEAQTSQAKKRPADKIDIADKPPVDFFGRPIVMQTHTTADIPGERPQKKFRVSYRFNEGNSAAVRKPVKVAAFL